MSLPNACGCYRMPSGPERARLESLGAENIQGACACLSANMLRPSFEGGGELSECVCNGVVPPKVRYFNEMWCLLDSVLLQSVPSPSCNWCRSACCVLPLQVGDRSPNQQQVQPAEGTQLYQSGVAAPDAPWCQCQVSSMGFFQLLT